MAFPLVLPPTRIKFIKLSGFDEARASSLLTVSLSSGSMYLVTSQEGEREMGRGPRELEGTCVLQRTRHCWLC